MDKIHADIFLCNHFDLTWRRCYKRSFEYKGKHWASYSDIQEYYIDSCLKFCELDENFAFNIECIEVMMNYLEKHPEALSILQKLYKEGRLDIPFAGYNIIDVNLVSGESIIRNYSLGAKYMKRFFGEYTPICYRRDGFGNSAQLPQIMKGFDVKWIWGLSYSEPNCPLWKGLDGTIVYCEDPYFIAECGSVDKYRPCDVCNGMGEIDGKVCPACDGKKIHWKDTKYDLTLHVNLPIKQSYGIIGQRSEELIPPESMLLWPKQLKENYGIDARFGTFRDIYLQYREKIDRTISDPNAEILPSCELNPNNTGVYVTRSFIKREYRRLENRLFALERILSMAVMQGMDVPVRDIESIWEKLLFTMFHDAITGTIVDAAYDEIKDVFSEISDRIDQLENRVIQYLSVEANDNDVYTIVNPLPQESCQLITINLDQSNEPFHFVDEDGKPLLILEQYDRDGYTTVQMVSGTIPPFSSKTVYKVKGDLAKHSVKSDDRFIENERYKVEADSHGIISIIDKKTGKDLFQNGEMRIHEIIIEHDEGSPWATLSEHRPQTMLTKRTKLVSVEKNDAVQKMTFYVEPFNTSTVKGIEIEWTVLLTKGIDRIDFKTRIYWDTYNERVRIAFPTKLSGRHLYEIPYGVLERQPYKPNYDSWFCANGDWPAINWAGISSKSGSVALFNRGIPSYRMDRSKGGDIIYLSLLRSPAVPTYLHEPRSYSMVAYDGMRDAGIHEFEYAIAVYDKPLEETTVIAQAEEFNMPLVIASGRIKLPKMPIVESENVRISAVTTDETGALILRLLEFRGIGGKLKLQLPENIVKAQLVQLNEKVICDLSHQDHIIELEAKPFEILTIRLAKEKMETK